MVKMTAVVEKTKREPKSFTWPLFLALCASTGGSSFVFGYNVGVMNAPADIMQTWIRNESYPSLHGSTPSDATMTGLWCWIMAVFNLSGAVGGLVCGYMADRFGRKGAMLATDGLVLAGALVFGLSKVTNVYFLLLVGRIMIGICAGICSSLPAIYLTEIAPLHLRGIMGSMNSVIVILAIFLAQAISQPQLLGTENLWPLMLAFTGFPAIFQLAVMPFCVESPKYLMAIKKRPEEARAALVVLRRSEHVDEEMNSMLADCDQSTTEKGESLPSAPRGFWWPVSICVVNHMAQHFSGINAVLFFSSTIFRDQAQMSNQRAVGATLGVGAIFLLAGIISAAVVDRLGRRLLILIGVAGCLLFNVLVFVALHLLAIDRSKFYVATYFAIIFLYLFVAAFAFGPSSVPWFYTSEIFEPRQRGRANMITTTVNWLSGFIVSYTFLPLKALMSEYVFLLYAGMMAAGFVYLYLFAPETKGRQVREVAEEIEARKPACFRK